jgi:hypothetical protein
MKKKYYQFLILFLILITLSSCAAKGETSYEYGFWGGSWHGICLPFAIIGKLFGFNIGLYAENNSGFFYWFGFISGVGAHVLRSESR